MNAAPGVLAQTREAVKKAAQDLGYQPNAAARALRSRSSRLIGCMFSDLENPLYARLFNALQDRWAEEGFVTLISASSSKVDRERRAIQTFAERGLDAIVIAPGQQNDAELLQLLRDFPAPIFVVDRDLDIQADQLLFDHEDAMQKAVRHLAALGHERILPVFARQATRSGLQRHAAFDRAMQEVGLTPTLRVEPETANSPVFNKIKSQLSGPNRPTAMIVQGTQVLLSTLNALAHEGLNVPLDVSLIAVGDSSMVEDHVPSITALQMNRDILVQEIADRVLARIRGTGDGIVQKVLQYDLVERGSCSALAS